MVRRNIYTDVIILFVILLLFSPLLGRNSLYLMLAYSIVSFIVVLLFSRDPVKASFIGLSEIFIVLMLIPMISAIEQYISQAIAYSRRLLFWKALYYTVISSFISALLGVFFAVPFGYAYSRELLPFRDVIRSFIEVPMMLPHTIAGILLLGVFSKEGLWQISLTDTLTGIVVAMFFVSAPIAVNQMIEAFNHVPERYEHVSRSLGATPFKTFLYVLLPMVRSDIVSAFITSFMRAMSEFGAVIVITSYPPIISLYAFRELSLSGIVGALAVSTLSILIMVPVIIAIKLFIRRKSYGRAGTGEGI